MNALPVALAVGFCKPYSKFADRSPARSISECVVGTTLTIWVHQPQSPRSIILDYGNARAGLLLQENRTHLIPEKRGGLAGLDVKGYSLCGLIERLHNFQHMWIDEEAGFGPTIN